MLLLSHLTIIQHCMSTHLNELLYLYVTIAITWMQLRVLKSIIPFSVFWQWVLLLCGASCILYFWTQLGGVYDTPPWSKAGSDTLAGCLVQHHSWTYSHDPMLTSLSSFSSLTSTSELGSSFSSFPSLHPFYKSPDGLDCSCFPQDIYRPCFQLDVRRYLHVHHIYTLCPQPHPAPVHIFHCPSPIGNV